MSKTYLRGDLYYADLGHGIGSEQKGTRPVVIIQNNVGNKHSPTWTSGGCLATSADWTRNISGASTTLWQSVSA